MGNMQLPEDFKEFSRLLNEHRLATYLPFFLVALIFLSMLSAVAWTSIQLNDGHWIYTLDDPYIHMAMAKNIALHGVFGATPYEPSSSTSSPLWTLLLALAYRCLGIGELLPGILATIFALADLYVVHRFCRFWGLGALPRFVVGCCVVYFTPLVALVSTGMEHTMHIFFVLLLFETLFRNTESSEQSRWSLQSSVLLGGWALLATATRYETLFVTAPITLFLWFWGHKKQALTLASASFLPVLALGLFSWLNGSYFLPNSLMLKVRLHEQIASQSWFDMLGFSGIERLFQNSHLLTLILFLGLATYLTFRNKVAVYPLGLSLASSMFLHLHLAEVGWFYRYEAYLIATVIPLAACLLAVSTTLESYQRLTRLSAWLKLALGVCLLVCLSPLHARALGSLKAVPSASHHIYQQQYQMGQFVRDMYDEGARIAVNDLGAVAFFSEARILDLYGLGSIQVTRAMRQQVFNTDEIRRLLHLQGTEILMVYTYWFQGESRLPQELIRVADWNVNPAYYWREVAFFATSVEAANTLSQRLHEYEETLPKSVSVVYYGVE